jgi:enamine deaminase RidA (YjgF/YER057c/UK114 family)
MNRTLQPEGWKKPIGYANGVSASGRMVFVGGQVGWNQDGVFEGDDLVAQVKQTLLNIVEVLACDGARPEHVTTMTWYLLDKHEYIRRRREIGVVYRETMGRNFPAMAVVEVSGLIEERALVEIQATAMTPDERARSNP